MTPRFPTAHLSALAAALLVSACATVDPAADRVRVEGLVADRSTALAAAQTPSESAALPLETWRAEPMTRERAVRVALVQSPRVQRVYAELGLEQAEVLEALELANPTLEAARLIPEAGPGAMTSYGLVMPLVDLLVAPARTRLARQAQETARLDTAAALLEVIHDVERAWIEAVAARQVADMRAAVARGLAASATLAQRFFDAGNIAEIQLAREQAAASEATIEARRAAIEADEARLALINLIGLTGADAAWPLATALPLPVAAEEDLATLQSLAEASSLPLRAARERVGIATAQARSTRLFRWFGGAEIGGEREREPDGEKKSGVTGAIEIPLFNQGQARTLRANARLALARARLAEIEGGTGNAIETTSRRVGLLREIITAYRDGLVPQRETIVARAQEQQNYMLIGVFELIEAKTQEYNAYQGYLEAIRDYWLARADLAALVGARLPADANPGPAAPSVTDIVGTGAPPPPIDHSGHGGHGAHNHSGDTP